MIRVDGVTHYFHDGDAVLEDIRLDIAAGECFGLIGANGAGKTTLLRILATLLVPASGRVSVAGFDLATESARVRPLLGYIPEAYELFAELTVEQFLDYTVACYGYRGAERKRRVASVISLTDLGGRAGSGCRTLSRGTQQRVMLARALVNDPTVLIFDEPTGGLDPAARIEFREIMRELTAAGKTSIVSSHILADLSEFATSVGILERGRVVLTGRVDEIAGRLSGPVELEIEFLGDAGRLVTHLGSRPEVRSVRVEGSRAFIVFAGSPDAAASLLRSLIQSGAPVVSFSRRRSALEDLFVRAGAFEVS